MNWLDIVLLILLGGAAIRGFSHGFVIESCSLLGLVLGIWAGVHLNNRAAQWIGLDPEQEVLSFIVVFVAVLVIAYLIGRGLTKLIDVAQLTLPNKVAGIIFGVLRSAFVLSILLNVLGALEQKSWTPSRATFEASRLYAPIRAFAPMIVPALEETKWVKRTIEQLERGVDRTVGQAIKVPGRRTRRG